MKASVANGKNKRRGVKHRIREGILVRMRFSPFVFLSFSRLRRCASEPRGLSSREKSDRSLQEKDSREAPLSFVLVQRKQPLRSLRKADRLLISFVCCQRRFVLSLRETWRRTGERCRNSTGSGNYNSELSDMHNGPQVIGASSAPKCHM